MPNHNTAMSGTNENVIDVIDTASKKLIGKIAVPPNPHWVAFGKRRAFLRHKPHVRHGHGRQCQQ